MARPTKYKPEYALQAKKLIAKGFTDLEVAEFFRTNVVTLRSWRAKFPEFLSAVKRGKAVADDLVERALFERATGYTHSEVHVSNYQGVITLTPILKHYAPDTAAAFIWLKNRRPDAWRDKPTGASGSDSVADLLREIADRLPG